MSIREVWLPQREAVKPGLEPLNSQLYRADENFSEVTRYADSAP
jgi:hypothetical protein